MKMQRHILQFLFLLLLSLGFSLVMQGTLSAQVDRKIKWMTLEEAEAAAKKDPKPIIIDLYTDWCGYCKRLDVYTFSNREIAKYINENFYPVKFNAEGTKVVRFRDVDYAPQAMGKTHQLALALTNGRLSYPTLVYLVKNYIVPVPGYYSPSQLEVYLHFFADGSYETVPFEEYQKNFKGELAF